MRGTGSEFTRLLAMTDTERLDFLAKHQAIKGFVGVSQDIYDIASECAIRRTGGDFDAEPTSEDEVQALRILIDMAAKIYG